MIQVRFDEKVWTEHRYPDSIFGGVDVSDRFALGDMVPCKALLPFGAGSVRDSGNLYQRKRGLTSIYNQHVSRKYRSRRASFIPVWGGALS